MSKFDFGNEIKDLNYKTQSYKFRTNKALEVSKLKSI